MKSIILMCVVCLQLARSYVSGDSDGVGAFAFQDSSGTRYGGTYGLKDGEVVNKQGNFPPNFHPSTFYDLDDFFPEYFSNFENLLQDSRSSFPFIPPPPPQPFMPLFMPGVYNNIVRSFEDNLMSQRLAIDAARKAFDLTSNQAGYIPNFAFGGGFPNMPGAPVYPGFSGFSRFPTPNFGGSDNSAFAAASLGPQFSQQIASINPPNPYNPNVFEVNRASAEPGGYKSVSSRSYSSSVNMNGETVNKRLAETLVDDNGRITSHRVES